MFPPGWSSDQVVPRHVKQDLHYTRSEERFGLADSPGLPVVTGGLWHYFMIFLLVSRDDPGLSNNQCCQATTELQSSDVVGLDQRSLNCNYNDQNKSRMMLHFSLKIWILSANDLLTIQLLLNILKQFRGYFVVTETKFKIFTFQTFASPS